MWDSTLDSILTQYLAICARPKFSSVQKIEYDYKV